MKTNISTLFKLELKSRFGDTKVVGTKEHLKRFFSVCFLALVYAVYIAGAYFMTEMMVTRSGLSYEFLVLASCVTLVLMTIVCTGSVVKNLYFTGDNELLLRFPVDGTEILIAKSVYVFAQHMLTCFLILAPVYMTFGIITSANPGYYFAAVVVLVLISLTPYFLANMIAIPVMLLVNLVKNRFAIVLAIIIGLLVGGFIIYMQVLAQVLEYIQNEAISLFSPKVIAGLRAFANNMFNPFKWYADLLSGTQGMVGGLEMLLSFACVLGITAITGIGAFAISKRFYFKTILHGIETEKVSFSRKPRFKLRSIFNALLHREFMLIFRSFNYSFQYLAMAVAAPVMVYYCNDLAVNYGRATVGAVIVPGLTLSVIILFSTIIVSFASTTISREGNCFYQTKVIPVPYSTQVWVKLFLYSIVATISALVSCLVVYLAFGPTGAKVINFYDVSMIFLISELVILGLTCASIRVDIKMPTFNVSGDGEMVAANKNVALAIFIGVAIAAIYGLFAMVFSIMPLEIGGVQIIKNKTGIYLVLLASSAVVFAVAAACLFPTIGKNYKKIVP
jgi:ABC-2 type transport system permease protein